MNCKLIHYTPLWVAANAIRMSHANHDKSDSWRINPDDAKCPNCGCQILPCSEDHLACTNCDYHCTLDGHLGSKDMSLIKRVALKMHHESTLEFLNYVWDLEIDLKSLLQLSRHRVGVSMTIRSTRYTTGKLLKDEEPFCFTNSRNEVVVHEPQLNRARKYIYMSKDPDVTLENVRQLEKCRQLAEGGVSDDEISYMLPTAWIYRGQLQFNARSLRHFFELRSPSTHAQKSIKELAVRMYNSLPDSHKFLYEEYFENKASK